MSEINGIWIIEADGSLLFTYKELAEKSSSTESQRYSDLILSITQFIKELGETDAERIEMGTAKSFISKDKSLNLFFIINTTQNASNSKISRMLTQIHERFLQKFSNFLKKFSMEELRIYLDEIFQPEVKKILLGTPEVMKTQFTDFFNKT